MLLFRHKANKSNTVHAMQYTNGAKPEVPYKLLSKTFFIRRLFGIPKWRIKTKYGYTYVRNGDFILRRNNGQYYVLGPKTFAITYERA